MAKAFVTNYHNAPYKQNGALVIDFEFIVIGLDVPNGGQGLGGTMQLPTTISLASIKSAIRSEVDRICSDSGLIVDANGLFIPAYATA